MTVGSNLAALLGYEWLGDWTHQVSVPILVVDIVETPLEDRDRDWQAPLEIVAQEVKAPL